MAWNQPFIPFFSLQSKLQGCIIFHACRHPLLPNMRCWSPAEISTQTKVRRKVTQHGTSKPKQHVESAEIKVQRSVVIQISSRLTNIHRGVLQLKVSVRDLAKWEELYCEEQSSKKIAEESILREGSLEWGRSNSKVRREKMGRAEFKIGFRARVRWRIHE